MICFEHFPTRFPLKVETYAKVENVSTTNKKNIKNSVVVLTFKRLNFLSSRTQDLIVIIPCLQNVSVGEDIRD